MSFYIQTFLWMISVYTYYIFFITGSIIGDYNSIILMVVSYILRACPIAGKYATFAHNQLKKVRKVKLTEKEIMDELPEPKPPK